MNSSQLLLNASTQIEGFTKNKSTFKKPGLRRVVSARGVRFHSGDRGRSIESQFVSVRGGENVRFDVNAGLQSSVQATAVSAEETSFELKDSSAISLSKVQSILEKIEEVLPAPTREEAQMASKMVSDYWKRKKPIVILPKKFPKV